MTRIDSGYEAFNFEMLGFAQKVAVYVRYLSAVDNKFIERDNKESRKFTCNSY